MLGGAIGLIGSYVIFPVKLYSEFKLSLLPILHALIEYAKAQRSYFNVKSNDLTKQKYDLQILFVASGNNYPDWIYEPGFNPALRSGFRYFLIKIERVIELFYSIDLCLHDEKLKSIISILEKEIDVVIEKNQELLTIIYNYFSNKIMDIGASDYVSDMVDLEKKLQKHIPLQIEVLDISPEYICLTSLVKNLKNTREVLIDMLAALPNEN